LLSNSKNHCSNKTATSKALNSYNFAEANDFDYTTGSKPSPSNLYVSKGFCPPTTNIHCKQALLRNA
jgi:hypothetical protein